MNVISSPPPAEETKSGVRNSHVTSFQISTAVLPLPRIGHCGPFCSIIYLKMVMELINYSVALIVSHSTLSIDDISNILSQNPNRRRDTSRNWYFEFDPPKDFSLAECIENVVESISAKQGAFQKLHDIGGTMVLSAGLFLNGNAEWCLEKEQMSRLANSHVNLRIWIYPPDGNDTDEPVEGNGG